MIDLGKSQKKESLINEDSLTAKLLEKMMPALKEMVQTTVEESIKKALGGKQKEKDINKNKNEDKNGDGDGAGVENEVEDESESGDEDDDEDLYWTPPEPSIPSAKTLSQQALEKIGELLKLQLPKWTCDEQRVAMEAVLECQKDVMAIMRTGSGKSMLMIIPSLLEKKKITVGVLPLKSLLSDYQWKLDEQRIPYEIFHNQRSPKLTGHCNLILIKLDRNVGNKSWQS